MARAPRGAPRFVDLPEGARLLPQSTHFVQGDRAKDHLVFITDPAKGSLRPIATREGIAALDIPPNIGGRFSVLTPVGVLPAALTGMDASALLAGAADMRRRCASDELSKNPAGT